MMPDVSTGIRLPDCVHILQLYSETDQKYSGRMVLGGRCGTGTGVYQVGVS